MNERKKAQDVFNDTNFVFAEKTTFEKAFPTIREISIEVTESDNGMFRRSRTSHLNKHNIGEYANCSNPMCYNGGFNIGGAIREMVSKNEVEREGSDMCQGYEGSPKGRKRYRRCWNEFAYKIHIEYVDEVNDSIEEDSTEL